MEDLIREYRESLRKIREAKKQAADKAQKNRLAAMERDLVFALREMGAEPKEHRDYMRRSDEQIEKELYRYGLKDPDWFDGETEEEPSIYEMGYRRPGGSPKYLCREEGLFVAMALEQLTDKQREAFLLHYNIGLSEREVAKELGISKTTARERIQGAQKRLAKWVKEVVPPEVLSAIDEYQLHGSTQHGARPTIERFRAWMKGAYETVGGQIEYRDDSSFDQWLLEKIEENYPEWIENTRPPATIK